MRAWKWKQGALLTAIIVGMSHTPAAAQSYSDCAVIKKSGERLACYDKQAKLDPRRIEPSKPSTLSTKNDPVGMAGAIKLKPICRGC